MGIKKDIQEIPQKNINNKYNITNFPGLIVDGNIVSEGKVLTVREIKKILNYKNVEEY